jgi:membrane-associated protein
MHPNIIIAAQHIALFRPHIAHLYVLVKLLHFLHSLSWYSYLLLFLGTVFEGEFVLLTAGFFAYLHVLNLWIVMIVALAGAIVGDNIWFAVGKLGGMSFLQKWGKFFFLSKDRINKASEFFDKHGSKTIFFSRFIFGTRIGSAAMAGTFGMSFKRFFLSNFSAAVVWVVITSLLGFFFGSSFNILLHLVHDAAYALLISALGVLIIVVLRFVFTQKDL